MVAGVRRLVFEQERSEEGPYPEGGGATTMAEAVGGGITVGEGGGGSRV